MNRGLYIVMAAALMLPLGGLRADGRVIEERKLPDPNAKYEQQLIQQDSAPVARPQPQQPAGPNPQLLQEEQRSLNMQQEETLRQQTNQWERRGYEQGAMEAQQGAYGYPGYGYPMPAYQPPYNATPPDPASFKHYFPKQFGGEYNNFDDQGPEGFRPVYRPYAPGSYSD